MKKQKITIEKYMTEFPHTIGDDLSLKTAQELMQKYHCRHLPVQHAGKLVGVTRSVATPRNPSFSMIRKKHREARF